MRTVPLIAITARQLQDSQEAAERRFLGRARIEWVLPEPGHQVVDESRLARHLRDADALVVGDDVVDKRVLSEARRLSLIVKWGVGVDAVDQRELDRRSIKLRNTPGLFGEEVADLAVTYLVMLTRGLVAVHNGVVSGEWPKPRARSTAALTVAVVGCGTVGQSVLSRLAGRVDRLLAVDPDRAARAQAERLGGIVSTWDDVVSESHALILCRPPVDDEPLLDARALRLTRPGAFVINVARGSLVDEDALAGALNAGHLGGAALDTYVREPLPEKSPLRSAPNVIFGAHNGSFTEDAISRANDAVMNILEEELQL